MEYKVRKLKSTDIFRMTKIISKIGVNDIKDCFDSKTVSKIIKENKDVNNDDLMATVGFNVVFGVADIILKNINKCENDLYEFLSELTGLTVSDIENLSPAVFVQMIIDVVSGEDFKDFFSVVLKSFK